MASFVLDQSVAQRPAGVASGTIAPRTTRLANILNHRILRVLLLGRAKQHTNPQAAGDPWPQYMAAIPLAAIGPTGVTNGIQLFHIMNRSKRKIVSDFFVDGVAFPQGCKRLRLTVDSHILVLIGPNFPPAQNNNLQQAFDYFTQNGNLHAIKLFITQIEPQDVRSPWFTNIAAALARTKVEIGTKINASRALDTSFPHRDAHVAALTAITLAMKCYGDLVTIAQAFSYKPDLIAREIRNYRLGHFLGTQATRYLLACIFEQMRNNGYEVDQLELIAAATDLLVAHMSRHDHHQFLRRAEPGSDNLVEGKLVELLDIRYHQQPFANFDEYLRMAALRDGIIWGSMRAYVDDLDEHNDSHVKTLNAFVSAAVTIISVGANVGPMGQVVAGAVDASGGLAIFGASAKIGKRWEKGKLDQALQARFKLKVERRAMLGHVPRAILPIPAAPLTPAQMSSIKDNYLPSVHDVMDYALNGNPRAQRSWVPAKGTSSGRGRL